LKILLLITMLSLLAAIGCNAKSGNAGTSYTAIAEFAVLAPETQKMVPYEDLIKRMTEADVIFVGENHDHTIGHMLEAKLLRDLYARCPGVSVSFEMFERDVQTTLDDYLAGKIPEEKFLADSRPWPNYAPDYKPMLEFAKANSLPVVAANIPRKMARMVAMGGVDGLPAEMKKFCAREVVAPDDRYKELFLATMKQMGESGSPKAMPVMAGMYEAMYVAQCSKDCTMAESIVEHIAVSKRKVIHYNGCFHSDYTLGTAQNVKRLNPGLKVLVIKIVPSDKEAVPPFEDLPPDIADFVLLAVG